MKKIELSLIKGKLEENGKIDEPGEELSKGSNKVLITVHNTGIPNESLLTSRDAEFKDAEEYIFADEYKDDQELYLTKFYRGEVYSDFYIEVEVTSVTKPTKAAKFIYKLLNGISDTAIGEIPGSEIVTSAIKVVGSSLFEVLKPEDKIHVLGRGVQKVTFNQIADGEITIDLKLPKDVKMTKVSYERRVGQQKRKDKAIRKYQEVTIEKGNANGFITLGLGVIG